MGQADPWVEAAKNFKAQPQSTAAPASGGNDDWKVWQDQGSGSDSSQPEGILQKIEDNWHSNTDPQNTGHPVVDAIHNIGGRAAKTLVSPFVNLPETLKGIGSEITAPPGLDDPIVQRAEEFSQDYSKNKPLAFENLAGDAAGTALQGGLMGAGENVLEKVPTRAKAGQLFQHVMEKAGDQPVNLTRTMEPLERTQQLASAGGKPFGVADKLYQRINTVNPLTYREARDFASNMSLSPEERMGLKGSMQREVPRLSHAFNADVGDAAEAGGVRPQYDKAMRTYRIASRNRDIGAKALKWGGRAAAGAAGLGGAYELKKAFE